ncbi:hypothetical protein AHAS_Ahas20G0087600 [Arachis hypogaea]
MQLQQLSQQGRCSTSRARCSSFEYLTAALQDHMVGSNSPNIIRSRNWGTTITEPPNKKEKPRIRTYKRRNTRNKSNTNDDPDYLPKLNHISNLNNGLFKFSRSKGKPNISLKTATPKSGYRGMRNLFPTSMISPGCYGPTSSYVTNTTVKIARARNLQQKFMLHRNLDSSFMAEDVGKIIPKGMPVSFQPNVDMEIEGLHLPTAAYIFNTTLDQEEMLVPNPHCAMTRKALRTLEPGKQLVDNI